MNALSSSASTPASFAPSIALIIPAKNEARVITECLMHLKHRCAEQSYFQNIKCIVVDGFSQDNTFDLAKEQADFVLSESGGRSGQMNAGAKACDADILIFLHVDTKLPESFFADVMKMHKGQYTWGFSPVRLDGKPTLLRVVERMISLRSRLSRIATGDQVFVITRKTFNNLNGYAPIALMEDVEWGQRCKRLGLSPWVFDQPVLTSSRRWEQKGIIQTIVLMWRLRFLFWIGVSPSKIARLYR